LPPSPPKPRTGDEAGGAGSNRTSVPGRGHHTTALSWTQCQSFLDNIIAGFQPNLSLNDRRNDDRTPTRARIVSATDSNGASANRSMYESLSAGLKRQGMEVVRAETARGFGTRPPGPEGDAQTSTPMG
jgi:hypothetical protein